MVENNDLSSSFLCFDKAGPAAGASSEWTEMWVIKAYWPCLTPSEWLWAEINHSQTMQCLERGGGRTMDRVKVCAGNSWTPVLRWGGGGWGGLGNLCQLAHLREVTQCLWASVSLLYQVGMIVIPAFQDNNGEKIWNWQLLSYVTGESLPLKLLIFDLCDFAPSACPLYCWGA